MRLLPVIPDGLMNGTVNDSFLSGDIRMFIDLLRTLKDKKQEFLDIIKSM